jgi:NADH-quinone oxidoreductase subunit L
MTTIGALLVLIPALPLAATLLTAVLGKRVLRDQSHWPTVLAIGGALAASLALVFAVQREAQQTKPTDIGYEKTISLWTWANVNDAYHPKPESGTQKPELQAPSPKPQAPSPFHIDIVLRADPLTAVMLLTVTFVSFLVAVYSIGYMHDDPGYWRFFTYISLFVFSMTMLVSVSNFVLLYVFWEAVGLCSYLLIGFWYQKPAAAAAGTKAFLVNRVGDFGFALGVFLLWTTYGTLNFHDTPEAAGILGQLRLHGDVAYVGGGVATAICLLLFLGACGKSAQFPLHVWLPDAMEGPTPVSALIHAATMVTAGVYMVARCTPLFMASPDARYVVAAIGCFTAVMAAIIAMTQTDLKRILAYSTISQLGYMFLGLGAGTLLGVTSAMFHLATHAVFKALLFLGAGSVMHAMGGVIDIRQFSGLRHRLPVTHWTFLFGALALAGVVPFAGFWSKDAILAAVAEQGHGHDAGRFYWALYLAASVAALLTAVYTFRAFFLTFYGEERIPPEAGHHAHESPPSMTGPLSILAFGAVFVGLYFHWTEDFTGPEGFLVQTPSLAYASLASEASEAGETAEATHTTVLIVSTVLAFAGVGLAAALYLWRRALVNALTAAMSGLGLYGLSQGKFFFDPIYRALVVRPLEALARLSAWFDRTVIDGLVNAIGLAPTVLGAVLRPLQGGMVQFYALAMVLGVLALIGALLM